MPKKKTPEVAPTDTTPATEPLTGTPAVEKTVEEYKPEVGPEEAPTARTYDVHGVEIQYLDGKPDPNGFVMNDKTELVYTNPVPVHNDVFCKGSPIGTITLYVENNVLKGDLFLDYQTPERLAIEAKTEPFYPSLTSRLEQEHIDGFRYVEKATVIGVALTHGVNVDARIGAVK